MGEQVLVEIEHITCGEKRMLPFIAVLGVKVHLRWPMRDDAMFSVSTGGGYSKYRDWRITPAGYEVLNLPKPSRPPRRLQQYREALAAKWGSPPAKKTRAKRKKAG